MNDLYLVIFTALVGVTWGCQMLVLTTLICLYLAGYTAADLAVWPAILLVAFFGKIVTYARGLLR